MIVDSSVANEQLHSAGTGGDADPADPTSTITTADRAGAGIITAIILITLLGGAWSVYLFFHSANLH